MWWLDNRVKVVGSPYIFVPPVTVQANGTSAWPRPHTLRRAEGFMSRSGTTHMPMITGIRLQHTALGQGACRRGEVAAWAIELIELGPTSCVPAGACG